MTESSEKPATAGPTRSRAVRIIAILLLLTLGGCWGFNHVFRWQGTLLNEATQLMSNEQYGPALEKFETVLAFPLGRERKRDALDGKSICLSGLDRLPEAITAKTALIDITDTDGDLMYQLSHRANLHFRSGDFNAAVEDMTQSLVHLRQLSPGQQARLAEVASDYYMLRGRAYEMLGDDGKAQKDFDAAAELEPHQ